MNCALIIENLYVRKQLVKDLEKINIKHTEIKNDEIANI